MESKEELRRYYYNLRQELNKEKINESSLMIKKQLFGLEEIKNSINIMVYISFRNEVMTYEFTKELLSKGKRVYVPYCLRKTKEMKVALIDNFEQDLVKDTYGILAPREDIRDNYSVDQLEIVIVPGIVFSRIGRRIGYGGGYYDRFLAGLRPQILTIGLTYDRLLVDFLPVEKHDQDIDKIVTEKEIIDTKCEVEKSELI